MKTCPKCRTSNPLAAGFCMKCGDALAPVASPAIPTPIPPKPLKHWIWISVAGVAALAGGVALGMSGILRSDGKAPSAPLTMREGTVEPPRMLEVQRDAAAGVTQRNQLGMPADIRAWLEHLERVERRRRDLATSQIGKFMVTMTQMQMAGAIDALNSLMDPTELTDPNASGESSNRPESADRFATEIADSKAQWRALQAEFQQVPPPGECMPLRDQYSVALNETVGMMVDLLSAMETAFNSQSIEEKQSIVSKLYGMKGDSEIIDQAGGKSDQMLGELCRKYETPKWFTIASDIGGGGMMRAPAP